MPAFTLRLKNYTIDEYKSLTEFEKNILRKQYDDMIHNQQIKYADNNDIFFNNLEIIHDYIADNIKTNFDKKYGNGKYTVLTIGRSLSSIGKVLGYKIGEDKVKNIPLSNAKHLLSVKKFELNAISAFRQYLDSIGLSENNVKSTDKKFILIDYCISGGSLKGAKKLFDFSTNTTDKFNTEDIMEYINDDKIIDLAEHHFGCCNFKPYSFVKKSFNLVDTPNNIKNPKSEKRYVKLVWFKLLDNEMTAKNRRFDTLSYEFKM